jgi:cobalt-zinc-cadmium efflux system membrane fusion protein
MAQIAQIHSSVFYLSNLRNLWMGVVSWTMKYRSSATIGLALVAGLASCLLPSCKGRKADPAAEAPPPAQVEHEQYGGPFKVDHPEQFALAMAGEYKSTPELNVTGIVSPDMSRNVLVISIASGGVGDARGPASGVISDQQVTNAAGVQGSGSPNPFAISALSHVWVLCDVYENDLPFVRLGEHADIHLSGYPDLLLKGRINNIGPILDPNLRTAKVRLEVQNPGMLRPGMFVTATFYGLKKEMHATVPASAILHLHDRDYVYVPIEGGRFQHIEVVAGKMLPGTARVGAPLVGAPGQAVAAATPPLQEPGERQEIISGIRPGQPVVANALALQAAAQ